MWHHNLSFCIEEFRFQNPDSRTRFQQIVLPLELEAASASPSTRVGVFNHFGTVSAIIGVWFGAGAMFVFLALTILYPNDRLTGFAMATKNCRVAKLNQRPMRSLSVSK